MTFFIRQKTGWLLSPLRFYVPYFTTMRVDRQLERMAAHLRTAPSRGPPGLQGTVITAAAPNSHRLCPPSSRALACKLATAAITCTGPARSLITPPHPGREPPAETCVIPGASEGPDNLLITEGGKSGSAFCGGGWDTNG